MTLFLDRPETDIQIIKEVVKAAAENYWNGKEVMTEEVVEAAATLHCKQPPDI